MEYVAKSRSPVLWSLSLAALLTAASQSAFAAEPIQVGMAVSLTGYIAAIDSAFVEGAKLATKKINDTGGVKGRLIKLNILDNASNATTGVTVTNQLINQYGVTVLVNGGSSAQSVALQPIIAREKLPLITTSQLPPNYYWAYLATIAYPAELEIQLKFARDDLKAKRLAFLYTNTPYGQNGAKLLTTLAPDLGLEIVYSEGVDGSSTDVTPQLAKIKDAKPDVLLDFMSGSIHLLQAKAATTVGLGVPIINSHDETTVLGQAAEQYAESYAVFVPIQAYPNLPNEELKAANAEFLAAYTGANLDIKDIAGASPGWDAIRILARAVEVSGATAGQQLRDALEEVSLVGTVAHFKYSPTDHTGQLESRALQVGRFRGGKLEIVKSAEK